jgi:RND family efflux transporter MFP subunit
MNAQEPERRHGRRTPYLVLLLLALSLFSCEHEGDTESPPVPVRTEAVTSREFSPTLTLLGVVRAAESIPLRADQHGTIRYPRRFARGLTTGAHVSRGDLLAEVRNDDVRFNETQARLQRDAAAADFERKKRGFEQGITSPAEYDSYKVAAELAQENYNAASRHVALLRIVSPSTGTLVVTQPVASGATVEASTVLADIVTGGTPRVESNVAASQRPLLRAAQRVTFAGRGTPAWRGSGTINEVDAVVGEGGTSRVVAVVDSGAALPPPGTGVELHVELDRRPSVITVPEEAIVAGSDGAAVFVVGTSAGRPNAFNVKRVAVETGSRAGGRVEITSGLHDGDRVVISGADSLSEETVVREADKS